MEINLRGTSNYDFKENAYQRNNSDNYTGKTENREKSVLKASKPVTVEHYSTAPPLTFSKRVTIK
jgi:hypothetical protein